MSLAKVTCALRISAVDVASEDISRRLALEPTRTVDKGAWTSLRSGSATRPAPRNLWIYDLPLSEEEPLEAHVKLLAAAFAEKVPILRELEGDGCRIDLFVGVFLDETGNSGLVLSPESLRDLAALGLSLGLDIYC